MTHTSTVPAAPLAERRARTPPSPTRSQKCPRPGCGGGVIGRVAEERSCYKCGYVPPFDESGGAWLRALPPRQRRREPSAHGVGL
mgnify:CR=1 FL=1